MHSERIDGYNPLAVADAVERKREVLEEGQGPVLLDTVTYRFFRAFTVGCVLLSRQIRNGHVVSTGCIDKLRGIP